MKTHLQGSCIPSSLNKPSAAYPGPDPFSDVAGVCSEVGQTVNRSKQNKGPSHVPVYVSDSLFISLLSLSFGSVGHFRFVHKYKHVWGCSKSCTLCFGGGKMKTWRASPAVAGRTCRGGGRGPRSRWRRAGVQEETVK